MKLFSKTGREECDANVSKAFASGGEGSICEHPNDKKEVIKVYHKPRDLKLESALIELSKLDDSFVKPREIYYNSSGNQILGFSMKYIDMSKYVILKKIFNNTFCLQEGYDKKIKYKIYQNLKLAVAEAHQKGIYVGDLNPYNVLVNKYGDILLLDVDSFGTPSKPHNGVLLEDIRDWLYNPRVDTETDKYAFDVLTFWMFTFTHPFRGDYPKHKNLEERVIGKSSLLSGLPIVSPKCYQPFTNQIIIDQFKEVFQDGKRFFVDLSGQPQILQATTILQPAVIDSTDLYIRKIDSNISSIRASQNFVALLKDSVWHVYNVENFGKYYQMYSITDADDVCVGNKNVVYFKNNLLWKEGANLNNIGNVSGMDLHIEPSHIFIASQMMDKYECVDVDSIMSNSVMKTQNPIYAKSLNYGDGGMWQNIGDKKWLIDQKGSTFNIIKTDFNIKNVYKRQNYVLIEHLDKNKVRYTLCKINGLKLEIGCDLPEWKYFDVKQDFIFIPEDGKINMINPTNGWKIVSEIVCPVSTFDSRIYHTHAGMAIQNNDTIYLINKK